MASSSFALSMKTMLAYEGGYSNHPRDPGGVTLEGVIQRVYDAYRRKKGLPTKCLMPQMRGTPEWTRERDEIYRKNYWDAVSGDALAAGVDLVVFDFGVNSGPARAKKYLMASLGGSAVDTVKKVCAKRMSFLRGLGTFATFGKGWTRRVTDVEAKGVKLALQGAGKSPDEVRKDLEKERDAATKDRNKDIAKGGGGAVGGGAGGSQVPDAAPDVLLDPSIIGWVIAVVVAGAVIYFGYRAYMNHKRAKAFQAVAQEN